MIPEIRITKLSLQQSNVCHGRDPPSRRDPGRRGGGLFAPRGRGKAHPRQLTDPKRSKLLVSEPATAPGAQPCRARRVARSLIERDETIAFGPVGLVLDDAVGKIATARALRSPPRRRDARFRPRGWQ